MRELKDKVFKGQKIKACKLPLMGEISQWRSGEKKMFQLLKIGVSSIFISLLFIGCIPLSQEEKQLKIISKSVEEANISVMHVRLQFLEEYAEVCLLSPYSVTNQAMPPISKLWESSSRTKYISPDDGVKLLVGIDQQGKVDIKELKSIGARVEINSCTDNGVMTFYRCGTANNGRVCIRMGIE